MYLVVTRNFPPEIGGIQNLMWGLVNSLSKYDIVKVFADFQKGHLEFDEKVNFSIERVGGPKLLRKYRKSYLINNYLKKTNNINCIIADHWKSLELIQSNKKKVCLIHSKEINHKKGSRLNLKVLKVLNNVDYVVANSKYTMNLALNLGVNSKKLIVINPGVDPVKNIEKKFLIEANNIFKNKYPKLITVSRFDKRKNHEKVIMAVKNLKQIYPDILYTCIGYGDEEENLKKLVNELKINENVKFLKNINENLKNALVSKSQIFVMPSIIYKKSVEGFGIAYVEAAQYGVPSIGGVDGGAEDAIINEKTGLLCNGNSIDDIYSKIILLLENKKYLDYGKSAKIYSDNFLWDKLIKKYKNII